MSKVRVTLWKIRQTFSSFFLLGDTLLHIPTETTGGGGGTSTQDRRQGVQGNRMSNSADDEVWEVHPPTGLEIIAALMDLREKDGNRE